MPSGQSAPGGAQLPDWVPEAAIHYLAHTELGQPIRALARDAGCHASTVLRQIRRYEMRRDCPLVDGALKRLGQAHVGGAAPVARQVLPDGDTLEREAMRVLRRLCETGSVLAVAAEMDKAVVVRDTAGGGSTRTAVVVSAVAQAMALKDWIAPANTGRIVRYHITSAGRTALEQMLDNPALQQSLALGAGQADQSYVRDDFEDTATGACDSEVLHARRMRYSLAESPLIALSRRRDHRGQPFLDDGMVGAGERLREDFELGQMGNNVTQEWDKILSDKSSGAKVLQMSPDAATQARARVATALSDLGPGLSDVVMRCCCYLEGLETTEKHLGWSARSGKVVLRIALIRLQKHYETTIGARGPMIG